MPPSLPFASPWPWRPPRNPDVAEQQQGPPSEAQTAGYFLPTLEPPPRPSLSDLGCIDSPGLLFGYGVTPVSFKSKGREKRNTAHFCRMLTSLPVGHCRCAPL